MLCDAKRLLLARCARQKGTLSEYRLIVANLGGTYSQFSKQKREEILHTVARQTKAPKSPQKDKRRANRAKKHVKY